MNLETINGWGLTTPGISDLKKINPNEIGKLFDIEETIIARGLGRSYGDASQNSGGSTYQTDELVFCDLNSGVLEADAGISIDFILKKYVPLGWFVPVTPGTKFVTIGGAVAADIHGKNHHKVGSIALHIVSFEIITPIGDFTCSPVENADLFWATIGGMGLTGIIKRVKIKMIKIDSSVISVSTFRLKNLEQTMKKMIELDKNFDYSVAWLDTLATAEKLGRAVITAGNHASLGELPKNYANDNLKYAASQKFKTPQKIPSGLLNKYSVGIFNKLWFYKSPKKRENEIQSINKFFYPLDIVKDWNRIYGYQGFVQYQVVVPESKANLIEDILNTFSKLRCPIFLAVLKRMGEQNQGLLSFPLKGWTLALDIPSGFPHLNQILDSIDKKIVEAGGRIYLAKDSRINPKDLESMYPNLSEFRNIRNKYDPNKKIRSDLSRRLSL
jgi:decaprenylphospho-beta-D-ribofuranose 2-oxidase